MSLRLQHTTIPQSPGVYFFRNTRGLILYIGKAANLRARLRSYLTHLDVTRPSGKTTALLHEATNLSWEVLGSEVEALIREAEFIKKYHPKYNVLMRDDKNYFYVGFTREKYPKIFVTHPALTWRGSPSAARRQPYYIGPFTDGSALRSVLKTLRRTFPYCTCKRPHDRPCFNAKIGRCLIFCCASEDITRPLGRVMSKLAEYRNNIRVIKTILSGKNKSLIRVLQKDMKTLSKSQHYEEAGRARDQIWALEKIFSHRDVIKQDMPSNRQKALRALEQILNLRSDTHLDVRSPQILAHRIEGYDISNIHGKYAYGSMVVFIDGLPAKSEYRIFKIRWPKLTHPSLLREPPLRKGRKTKDLFSPPCKGGGEPEGWGGNDPAMIHEIISRRLHHPEWPLPDAMLIDGGPTQLNAALQAKAHHLPPKGGLPLGKGEKKINKFSPPCLAGRRALQGGVPEGRGGIKIISLAKREEELYLSSHTRPIKLKESSQALFELLTHIRNESHRFAIFHYLKAHRKTIY